MGKKETSQTPLIHRPSQAVEPETDEDDEKTLENGDSDDYPNNDTEVSIYHDTEGTYFEDGHKGNQSVRSEPAGIDHPAELNQAGQEEAEQSQLDQSERRQSTPVPTERQHRQRQWNSNYRKPIEREPYPLRG